jgi:uncharacterized YccA/Bax inhibitor family protein
MALSNPAFGARSFPVATANSPTMTPEKLEELYGRPSAGPAETDRMSYEDTTVKTLVTLLFVLLGGTVGFFIPALALPFALVGFVLALVNIFKKKPSAPLVLAYGAAQGIFVGGISRIIENNYEGIIYQALLGTGIVFGVTLALFASGRIRASKRATKIFMIAMISYALFSVVNLVLQFTGVSTDPWGLASAPVPFIGIPFGLIIGPLAQLGMEGRVRHRADDHLALRGDPPPAVDHPRRLAPSIVTRGPSGKPGGLRRPTQRYPQRGRRVSVSSRVSKGSDGHALRTSEPFDV